MQPAPSTGVDGLLSGSAPPPPWQPDEAAPQCTRCTRRFSLVTRRHHCRKCGLIFCGDCSKMRTQMPFASIVKRPDEAPPAVPTLIKPVRVCDSCFVATGGDPAALLRKPPSGEGALSPRSASPAPTALPVQEVADEQLSIEGLPPPPAAAHEHPLPEFPTEAPIHANMGMLGLLSIATNAMATMKVHQNDPLVSAEDNGLNLASNLRDDLGITGYENQMHHAVEQLTDHHLPEGLCGFVIAAPPKHGTLGHAYGLRLYDFIFMTGTDTLLTADTTLTQFSAAMRIAFSATGSFIIGVYSFKTRTYRRVVLHMPRGKPNAILGVEAVKVPPESQRAPAPGMAANIPGVAEPSDDLYTKGWVKRGMMYVSHGEAVPIYAPLTEENQDVVVKVWRRRGPMWIGSNEYHPLYNYAQTPEPLYVEAWRLDPSGMLIRTHGNGYAQLPMQRVAS